MIADLTLQQKDNSENSLYLDRQYREVLIVDVNGEAIELDVDQVKQLIESASGWVGLVSA
jgi:transcriptional antiterminator Rof (Rho-off)